MRSFMKKGIVRYLAAVLVIVLAALAIQAAVWAGGNDKAYASEYIGEQKAKDIALSDAGLSEAEAEELYIYLDWDDGIHNYDIDFYHGGKEYEYELNATTGYIMDKSVEYLEYDDQIVLQDATVAEDTYAEEEVYDSGSDSQIQDDTASGPSGTTDATDTTDTTDGQWAEDRSGMLDQQYYDDDDDWDDDWDDKYDLDDYVDDLDDGYEDDYDDDWDDDYDDDWDGDDD